MNVKDYLKLLQNFEQSAYLLMCEYCGAESLSIGNLAMCSNCENIVTTPKELLEKNDILLTDSLNNLLDNINGQNYDAALLVYEELIKDRQLPQLLYAMALLNIKYSNHEITQINYLKPGFMDENAVHREKASKLMSSAKKLLAKGSKLAKNEITEGSKSSNLEYSAFLCEMKLGRLKAANSHLIALQKSGNLYVYYYAAMMFESRREHYNDSIKMAENLMRGDFFSVNAFYYIGLAMFKKHNYKEAKELLEVVNKFLKSENVATLLFETDYQLATYK